MYLEHTSKRENNTYKSYIMHPNHFRVHIIVRKIYELLQLRLTSITCKTSFYATKNKNKNMK